MTEALPGAELVEKGLADAAGGRWTVEGLLVAIAASRLRGLGLPVPHEVPDEAELKLYRLLVESGVPNAYGRYNSLVRRLVSYERALSMSRRRGSPTGG